MSDDNTPTPPPMRIEFDAPDGTRTTIGPEWVDQTCEPAEQPERGITVVMTGCLPDERLAARLYRGDDLPDLTVGTRGRLTFHYGRDVMRWDAVVASVPDRNMPGTRRPPGDRWISWRLIRPA